MAPFLREDHPQSLHHRLKEIFSSATPGRDDGAALQEVRRLCQGAKRLIGDEFCHAQFRQLERYARFFFSSEAHERWARDTGFGGSGLRSLVLQLLSGIELRLANPSSRQLSVEAAAQSGLSSGIGRT